MSEHAATTTPSSNIPALLSASPTGASGESVVVIQGIFDPTGDKLLELKPVRRYDYRARPAPNQSHGRFRVEVTSVTGVVIIVPFDALVANDANPGVTNYGFFEVVVPVREAVAVVRISDGSGAKTFARIDGAAIVP